VARRAKNEKHTVDDLLEDCHAVPEDLMASLERLKEFSQPFIRLLPDRRQHRLGEAFLRGLLSDLDRKSTEPIAENAGMMVKIVQLLEGKDPAECISKGEHFWKKSIEQAVPIYDFVIAQAFRKHDSKEVNGKRKISDEIIPFLAKIQNPIVLSHYIKKCAGELEVTEESIESAMDKFRKIKVLPQTLREETSLKRSRQERLEDHFLALLLQSEKVHQALESSLAIVSTDDFREPAVKIILSLLTGLDFFHTQRQPGSSIPEVQIICLKVKADCSCLQILYILRPPGRVPSCDFFRADHDTLTINYGFSKDRGISKEYRMFLNQ